MSHFKKMKLIPFNTPLVQQSSIKPLTQPTEVALEKNINEKSEILSSNASATRKNSKLNRNIQSFKVLAENILNKAENKKKPLKLENSVENRERKPVKLENLSNKVKKIKLEPIISDIKPIKPTYRRSSRLIKKVKKSYKKPSSSKIAPEIDWHTV